jgi:hypothetical protein
VRRGPAPDFAALRREDLPTLAHILDVAPSVLALLGLPAGADMPGVAAPGLLEQAELSRVTTHDTPQWRAAHAALRGVDPGEAARVEQLKRLGYVGNDAELPGASERTSSDR